MQILLTLKGKNMIIVDKALEKIEKEGKPIRVGIVGSGFMAKGLVDQLINSTPGIRVGAIANRTVKKAKNALAFAGVKNPVEVRNSKQLDLAVKNGQVSYTDNFSILCQSKNIDVIVDVTGAVEFGARVAFEAIQNKKNIVSMNVELDGTVGSILKYLADKAGVIYTLADGDQPGVILNLYRYVKGLGLKPVLCGNIKGLHDPYRNPTTQAGFAKKWRQKPAMVTSFADGTKISFEQAVVANATGMRVGKRGMHGPIVEAGTPIAESPKYYPVKDLNSKEGIVDYIVGAAPSAGVFVIAKLGNKRQKHYLNYYKLGDGPYYVFYTPFHICHFDVASSIARAFLFKDVTLAPVGMPTVDVIAVAKTDLEKGDSIDGLGGYATYGLCENYQKVRKENLLPIGIAEGCILKRKIKKDQVVTLEDVVIPEGRVIDKLRRIQDKHFVLKPKK
jgi:predicted homoserine dehydrogenase-like protein